MANIFKLIELNDQKEAWFNKKESCGKDISKLIKKVKTSKAKRDLLTKKVKADKADREKYNEKAKKKIEQVKKLNKEKAEVQKKHHIKEDPSTIKKQIQKIETIIETEAISFDKEKKLMDLI